jgi:signal transduction histidine kinase
MRRNASVIKAIALALLVETGGLCPSKAADDPVAAQDSPFLSRGTLVEFLQSAPGKVGGMARVQGVVIYQENRSVFVEDKTGGLLLDTRATNPLSLGTVVEAIGTIARGPSSLMLQNATVRAIRSGSPPAPLFVSVESALAGRYNMRLVTLRGRLSGREQRGNSFLLRLRNGENGFQAELRSQFPGDPLGYVGIGSLLRVTGVCAVQRDAVGAAHSFELLMRSPRDVLLLRGPAWWTAKRGVLLGCGVLLMILVVGAWALAVRQSISRQAARIRSEVQQQARQGYENLERRVQERTAQLQAVNRELEAFAYTISHDLRAPLRAVEGFATLVQTELGPERQSPEVQHALEVIRGSALRMSQLIEDLLEFARLGRIEASMSEVSLESLALAAHEELKVQIGTRMVEVEVHRLPPVYADSGMMRQLVTNLLSNAIKYTRPRDVAKIEIGSFDQDAETVYYVRDNGVGFDMRYASKLFGVFHRLHTDKRFEGTGVGLAIVHRILERHHGRIWVESEIDQGTTFYFTVGKPRPKADKPPGATEPDVVIPEPLRHS